MLELILVSARSNSHLELLNTFLSCDELIPEVGDDDILDEKHDKKIYSDISKYILNNVLTVAMLLLEKFLYPTSNKNTV